jgi:predicted RNA binding protein YcfA (HicA-like mRNA interferase family)
MPKLKLSGSVVIAIFEQFGFSIAAQRGSHAKLSRVLSDGTRHLYGGNIT